MGLLYFAFGLFVGFGCSIVFLIASLVDTGSSQGVMKRIERGARALNQEKGSVIYPKSEETIAMEEMFERNDRKGEDTKIGEIESNEK